MATRPPSRQPDAASPGQAAAVVEIGDSPSRKLRDAMAARLATLDDLSGEVLADRYALRRQIGRGGMGAVYLAEHVLIHKPVAVKVLGFEHSRRPRDIERFLQEARSASKIRHENIVDITDFGYTPEGLAFLVMEYLDGEDLAVTCAREKRLQWPRVVAIGRQICGALEAAHGEGIIHRDMKLENCFRIRRGDNDDFIKVLDFGIAKVVDDDYDPNARAMTGSALVGTPEYVAPELVRGLKSDARGDIYAVGVILYKLLTGEVPLRGESYMATLTKQILEPPVPPRQRAPDAGIPADLEAVVMHALEKEPERRFQTIQEMAAALAKIGGAGRVSGGTAILPPVPPAARRRLWVMLLGVALVLVAIGALVAYLLLQGPTSGVPAEVVATAPTKAPEPSPEPTKEPVPVKEPEPVPVKEPEPAATSDAAIGSTSAGAEDGSAATGAEAPPAEELPERLTNQDFLRGMSAVNGAVERCAKYGVRGMKVQVRVKVSGATGEVLAADVLGTHAGTSLGDCVARAARRATFPRAQNDTTMFKTWKL